MSLRLLAASLCVAAASAVAVVTKELPLAAPYFTVSAINVTAPAVISAPLPLVVMLSGYCLPADTQDSLQLGFRALAGGGGPGGGPLPASPPFVYAELRSARPVAVCDLCPTSVRAARAAGNLTAEFEAEVVAGLTVAGLCTAWAATPACCQPALPANVSDAAFVVDVVGLVSKAYPVDPNRVSVLGIANGGFLALRLACDSPQLFSAIVAYASGIEPWQCVSAAPTRVAVIQGTADLVVPYAGGYNSAMRPFPGHVDTAAQWARTEGCTGPPAVGSFDAGANLTVDTIDYASCRPGAAFSNWTIVSGQHFAPQDASYKIFQALLTRFMLPATRASTA